MTYDASYWDIVWSRPYGRYNKHHEDVWSAIYPLLGSKIVDLGCGPALIYSGKNIDVTGVDISPRAIVEAKKNYPMGKFIVADAGKTGLPSDSFDSALISGLLDYYEDWEIILSEARRITKQGGKILATLFNGYNNHNWTKYQHLTGNWYLYQETR